MALGGTDGDCRRLAALDVEGAEIGEQRLRRGDEAADFLHRQRHRRHAAGSEQHVGGVGLGDRVGDAVHARAARAQGRNQSSRGLRQAMSLTLSGMAHLSSLRRHDPDQVRWVGRGSASQPGLAPDTPRDCWRCPRPQARGRQDALSFRDGPVRRRARNPDTAAETYGFRARGLRPCPGMTGPTACQRWRFLLSRARTRRLP